MHERLDSLVRRADRLAPGRLLSAAAWTVASVIVGLNAWLLVGTVGEWMA